MRFQEISHRLRRELFESVEHLVYRLDPAEVRQLLDPPFTLNKDNEEDLRSFVPTRWQSQDEFISTALKRLEKGEHCYTRVEDGTLAHYGWMMERQNRSYVTEVHQWLELPPNCAVIYDFYTLPAYRGRGFYPACLLQSLHDAANVPGTQNIHSTVDVTNAVPRFWFEKFGAVQKGRLTYERILWWKRRSSATK
jgi:RimJ/RimL family protein N-acetyltransferase